MSTSICWELTCDGLVSRPGGVKDSHPLINIAETGDERRLQKPLSSSKLHNLRSKVLLEKVLNWPEYGVIVVYNVIYGKFWSMVPSPQRIWVWQRVHVDDIYASLTHSGCGVSVVQQYPLEDSKEFITISLWFHF